MCDDVELYAGCAGTIRPLGAARNGIALVWVHTKVQCRTLLSLENEPGMFWDERTEMQLSVGRTKRILRKVKALPFDGN